MTKLNFDNSSGSSNKIDEIKWFRECMEERYGVAPGLKESKDMIEHMGVRQKDDPGALARCLVSALDTFSREKLLDWAIKTYRRSI